MLPWGAQRLAVCPPTAGRWQTSHAVTSGQVMSSRSSSRRAPAAILSPACRYPVRHIFFQLRAIVPSTPDPPSTPSCCSCRLSSTLAIPETLSRYRPPSLRDGKEEGPREDHQSASNPWLCSVLIGHFFFFFFLFSILFLCCCCASAQTRGGASMAQCGGRGSLPRRRRGRRPRMPDRLLEEA